PGLDDRAGDRSAVGPHPRRRQVAMEVMRGRLEPDDGPSWLAEDEPRRYRELVDERRQRMLQPRHQRNGFRRAREWPRPVSTATFQRSFSSPATSRGLTTIGASRLFARFILESRTDPQDRASAAFRTACGKRAAPVAGIRRQRYPA